MRAFVISTVMALLTQQGGGAKAMLTNGVAHTPPMVRHIEQD